ncbi:PhzF family phenazine biosynthesis protein [Streptomyces candidus]|uniref:PhzF family phenazine biosynthesis protein n=1 Tax=Streptomyces candidus TaxID=67283 RepID=A0A7X0HHE6_9ACTN|nr:PhzF family phenazine biosynthesis protein [Streptomyces candidus]MBB6437702.1 PhzF family phenazine biosynthesis protein [Streptomyces candidus]GHH50509.1 oxidoreductase [Streptomyces candidus]
MRIRTVDAFTATPFHGNPAAVLLLEDSRAFPDDAWLQHVAAELNLSETAFAHPVASGSDTDADWALRWFTPTTEVNMCGHATLATAHVLHTTRAAGGPAAPAPVRFATRSGILTATARPDGALTLDFPTAPLLPAEEPESLAEALGTIPLSVHYTGDNVGDYLVELRSEREVRALAPDLKALAALSRRGVIATAAAEDPARGYDFVSRCFFPAVGIDEDPVTGSAHTALAPFWSARLGRAELTGLQGGVRTGLVHTAVHGDRTHLTGHAVTVLDSELLICP